MKRFLLFLFLVTNSVTTLFSSTNPDSQEIRVGITVYPPFVICDSVSNKGICVELWSQISDSLNFTSSYVKFADYPSMMPALADGTIDFVINPLSLTDKRLRNFRLTIPFYNSTMGVVTKPSTRIAIFSAIKHLLNWGTIKAALGLLSFVFVFAFMIWLVERRKNTVQFRKGHLGIFDGVWWAFVTMSTVGYGDKVPVTRAGRILTVLWMLYAVTLFGVFTAEISSELTVTKLQSDIKNLDDLRKIKVGTMELSGYASMLRINRMKYTPFQTISDGFSALDDKTIDAFIYDAGVLDYIISTRKLGQELVLKRTHIQEQYFCLAANRDNLELIDRINPVLLNIIEDVRWERTLEIYNIK